MTTAIPTAAAIPEADSVLVAAALAGDAGAYQRIMRLNNRRLFRVARSILQDDGDAEDAVQEGYISAFGALRDFRGDASLATWLTRIVVNEALRRSRRRKAGRAVPLDDGALDEILHAGEAHDLSGETPETLMLRAELRRLLEVSVDDLPASYRAVFILRAVEGLSVEETAASLDISIALVKTRLLRAKRRLRVSLGQKIGPILEDVFAFDGARCDRLVAGVCGRLGIECNVLPPST